MYAIIEEGSHQFRVREGDRIRVDRRDGKAWRRTRLSQGLADHREKTAPQKSGFQPWMVPG